MRWEGTSESLVAVEWGWNSTDAILDESKLLVDVSGVGSQYATNYITVAVQIPANKTSRMSMHHPSSHSLGHTVHNHVCAEVEWVLEVW